MTMKEVEQCAGLARANIRFYEREGLLSPQRMDNGYRDYTQADVYTLQRIKLLRSLHVPLDEIRALQDGSAALDETLARQLTRLGQEKQATCGAQDICRALQNAHVSFAQLDAQLYLADIDRAAREPGSSYFMPFDDMLAEAAHPWRRYLARMFDLALYGVLFSAFLGLVLHVNLLRRVGFFSLLDTAVAAVLMLLLEPLLLHLLGTTAGKALFGIRVETLSGGRLSYRAGFRRTLQVYGRGIGWFIPVYSLVRLWQGWVRCTDGQEQPWDEELSYTFRDSIWCRGGLFSAACTLLAGLAVLLLAAGPVPPVRGPLRVADFVRNYDYYAGYYGIDCGRFSLSETGQWEERPFDGTLYLLSGDGAPPEYVYTIDEDGMVTGVSFTVEFTGRETQIGAYEGYMALAALSFADAQNRAGLFSGVQGRIIRNIENHPFEDFSFTEAGVEITCRVEQQGYQAVLQNLLAPQENAVRCFFRLHFTAQLVSDYEGKQE